MTRRFQSDEPQVELVQAFSRPFENAVATARTCYSSTGIITEADVAGDGKSDEIKQKRAARRDSLAKSIYEAGHHTTLQHAHFQFALSNVSRHFIWSFLHSHPFYNSEQVSQRYVEVRTEGGFLVPMLEGEPLEIYENAVADQISAYHALTEMLDGVAAAEYYKRFPARRKDPRSAKEVRKKSQEIARYVLPVATFAYLYHTVSGLTLLRYQRMSRQLDVPTETEAVVSAMVRALLEHDPLYATLLEAPLEFDDFPEQVIPAVQDPATARAFVAEFDATLGDRTSLLVDHKANNEASVAQAVRDVLGMPQSQMSDNDALLLVLDPRQNRLYGESMNVMHHSKLGRTLAHASYTFRKKLSHTADSQDQRHRMVPASRPVLVAHLLDDPDYITPALLHEQDDAKRLYEQTMMRTWEAMGKLRKLGVSPEHITYLLPNAVSVRFTESADLLNLHHKLKSRLCYNAQEEIWRASLDESLQIRDVNPTIGRYLLPPCGLRVMSETRPICPEGTRYCGVPVWKLPLEQYSRVI